MNNATDEGFVPWPAQTAQRYRELGLWTGETLSEMLDRSVAREPERLAVVDAQRRLTYRQLAERTRALARGLARLGIAPR